jgi:type II secretory pathway pseudopilin PulG
MPTWDIPRRRVRTAGFGLLEMILTFVLVIAAGAGVFYVYQSAKTTADVTAAVDNASNIAGGIQQIWGQNPSGFTGLSTQKAIDAHVVPTALINPDGQTLQGPWGAMSVSGNFLIGTRFGYQITFQEVPAEACTKMALAASGRFHFVLVNNQAAIDANGGIAAPGAAAVDWAATRCVDSNTVSFVGI